MSTTVRQRYTHLSDNEETQPTKQKKVQKQQAQLQQQQKLRQQQQELEDERYSDELKYRDKSNNPPYKSIILAVVLLLVGVVLLVVGSMLVTGYIETEHWDRGYALIILGAITFAPGSYITAIAWLTFRGYKGYTYAMIPEYD